MHKWLSPPCYNEKTPPATIQRVNASISFDCASKPSKPPLNPGLEQPLRPGPPIQGSSARNLKDIALKRSPNTSHRSNRSIDTPPRPARHSPRPNTTTNNIGQFMEHLHYLILEYPGPEVICLYGTQSLHYLILEYPGPEVICLYGTQSLHMTLIHI